MIRKFIHFMKHSGCVINISTHLNPLSWTTFHAYKLPFYDDESWMNPYYNKKYVVRVAMIGMSIEIWSDTDSIDYY